MLYLLHAAGNIEELQGASSAAIDEASGCLVCFGPSGEEVARYPFLEITMYSKIPFPQTVLDTETAS